MIDEVKSTKKEISEMGHNALRNKYAQFRKEIEHLSYFKVTKDKIIDMGYKKSLVCNTLSQMYSSGDDFAMMQLNRVRIGSKEYSEKLRQSWKLNEASNLLRIAKTTNTLKQYYQNPKNKQWFMDNVVAASVDKRKGNLLFKEKCRYNMRQLLNAHPEKHINRKLANMHKLSHPQLLMFEKIKSELPTKCELNGRVLLSNGKSCYPDVLCREIGIGFEYDGKYWHQDKSKDDERDLKLLMDAGMTILHFNEDNIDTLDKVLWEFETGRR